MEEIRRWSDAEKQEMVYKLALLGATDKQMAEVMKVSIETFNYWKRNKPGFLKALEEGKTIADTAVAQAALNVCLGYDYEEDVVTNYKGITTVTRVTKHKPPNPWAIFKWLAMRQKDKWSETHKAELTQTNILNINKFDFEGMSMEELLLMKKMGLQRMAQTLGENPD